MTTPKKSPKAKAQPEASARVDRYASLPGPLQPLPFAQCTLQLSKRHDLFPSHRYSVDVPIAHIETQLAMLASDGPELAPDLDPEYQRAHVWTRDQQVRFIEYLLLGGEVSRNITFAVEGDVALSRWRLIDGKQRLTAIRAFIALEFGVFADETRPMGHFANAIADIRRIQYSIKFVVVELKSKLDELNLYLSINAAGTPHTQEELDRVRAMRDAEIERLRRKEAASNARNKE